MKIHLVTMKTKTATPVQKLIIQSDHFRHKAEELALGNLFRPDPAKAQLAREHALRAETFKAAAKLIGG